VQKDRADIGIAFDGDADRIGVIDNTGEIIWGDYLLIVYARDVLARTGKGQAIVFDVKASQALPEAVEKAGGIPVMWKTGHSLIEEKMHETHAPVGGEMSGHMFFTEGFYGFDDALYGAARLLRIIAESGKSVRELLGATPRVESVHPSPMSADRGFFGSRPFSRVNQLLTDQGAEPVDWALP